MPVTPPSDLLQQPAAATAAPTPVDAVGGDFPATAPAAYPVFYRTYSRRSAGGRESWHEVAERNLEGLRRLGDLNADEVALLRKLQAN